MEKVTKFSQIQKHLDAGKRVLIKDPWNDAWVVLPDLTDQGENVIIGRVDFDRLPSDEKEMWIGKVLGASNMVMPLVDKGWEELIEKGLTIIKTT